MCRPGGFLFTRTVVLEVGGEIRDSKTTSDQFAPETNSKFAPENES